MKLQDMDELRAQRPSDVYSHRCPNCDRWWTHDDCVALTLLQNMCDICAYGGKYGTIGFALFEGPLSGIIDGYWE